LTINQDMKALVTGPGLCEDFLAFALKGLAVPMLALVDRAAHGTCKLNTDEWSGFTIPIPPRDEQTLIAAHLNETEQATQRLANELALSIDLLREYRTALISAAVTGKIDVREHAP
jgi:type I restriction enzyme S subunit